MEDILLLQAIERYYSGAMQPAEKEYFEELRKNNPEIDQLAVEHQMFLQQLNNFSNRNNFKHNLIDVHAKLLSLGELNEGGELSTKAKVVSIWKKYKKVTGIAAAVGGGIALLISTLVAYFNPISPNVTKLGAQLKNQENQIAVLKNEIIKSKIPSKAEIKGGGSSFLIDGKGYLITNAHVVEGATSASVFNGEGKEFSAAIAYVNAEQDLAILKINDAEFEPVKNLPYGIKNNIGNIGEEIYTIGFPNFPRTDIVYNVGYLSSKIGYNGDTVAYQIQMNANHGNSGGPIFNKRGEVIGVLSTKLSKADGVSFAIKSKNIFQLVNDLKTADSTASNIKINTSTKLNDEDRVTQIKKIEHYVYMVKAYRN